MAIALGPNGIIGGKPLVNQPPSLHELVEALPRWQADAACREHPEVNFFPNRGEGAAEAKRVCAGCLVRGECLAYALDHEDGDSGSHGVWGGVTAGKRRDIRAGRLSVDQALAEAQRVGESRPVSPPRRATDKPRRPLKPRPSRKPASHPAASPEWSPGAPLPSCATCGLPISRRRQSGLCRRCAMESTT